MELWLRDESDAPESKSYRFDYHTGCMIQPSIESLVERLRQMPPQLHTEVCDLQTHAEKALEAERERNWKSAHQHYRKFLVILQSIGYEDYDRKFRNYGAYLWVTAWASIPCILYRQIKLGDYEMAAIHLGALRATRDDEETRRLPISAYASIDLHIRIVDWEASYMLKRRGQVDLSRVLAVRALRDFPRDGLLNAETPASVTLCHLLGSQHRRFEQYDNAKVWRSELRRWLLYEQSVKQYANLSLEAEVQITLDDVYLLCDMDELAAGSHKLLKLKQRISDDDMNLHLIWVMSVNNAWWQCRRYLALQDFPAGESCVYDINQPNDLFKKYQKIEKLIIDGLDTVSNEEFVPPTSLTESSPYTRMMQEVSNATSCIDDFTDTIRMIEIVSIAVTADKSTSAPRPQQCLEDYYFHAPSGRTRCKSDLSLLIQDSGLFSPWLLFYGTLGLRAEKSRIWFLAHYSYQEFLTILVWHCHMPPNGSEKYLPRQALFVWAALPYALAYHTQFKDFEHSIWLLRTIQIIMVKFSPSVPSSGAYAAVEMQMRMAAWEWSCALREEGILDKAEVLSEVATNKFPKKFMVGQEDAKASLCKLLANLYNNLGQFEEARLWDVKIASYVSEPQSAPPTCMQRVAGRISFRKPHLPKYPRIDTLYSNIVPLSSCGRPPPRASGSSSPERMFNADPNNSFIGP